MAFSLRLHDPKTENPTLLELLIASAEPSNRAGAAFAFASAHGVRLLLQDPGFTNLLTSGSFELIVGLDAVTTPESLVLLKTLSENFEGLTVKAFLHQRGGTIFHPKFAWFAGEDSARILVGSGNLTRGGLLSNWEAHGDVELSPDELTGLESEWSEWVNFNSAHLCEVDDDAVLHRAEKNIRTASTRHEEDVVESQDSDISFSPSDSLILLAQISGGGRWKQANFTLDIFQTFFQMTPGKLRRILLFPVQEDGTIGDSEMRQGVAVKSQNYRIELGLAGGLDYPTNGFPIGVFLRLGTRRFRYRLLMPGSADYNAISAFLDSEWSGPNRQNKRVTVSTETFRANFADFQL